MTGSRQTNTFGESLQKVNREFADMLLTPDADIEWINAMQSEIVSKIRSGIDGQQAAGSAVPGDPMLGQAIGMQGAVPQMGGAPGAPGMGVGMAGGGPGGLPPGPAPGVGGVNAIPGAGMPSSPDELRRILGQG
jgi:hypothetical protein